MNCVREWLNRDETVGQGVALELAARQGGKAAGRQGRAWKAWGDGYES